MSRPKYIASCSGGKDSVATLLLAAQMCIRDRRFLCQQHLELGINALDHFSRRLADGVQRALTPSSRCCWQKKHSPQRWKSKLP